MQLVSQQDGIWHYTTALAYNGLRREGYGAFLTDVQKRRIERIRQARMLFDGKHRAYFLDECRTQFQFQEVRVGTEIKKPYVPFNVLKLICKKTADLLFGEEPLLRVDEEVQQQKLSDLVDRSNLHTLFYNTAVEAAYEAEAFLEAVVLDGKIYLKSVPADDIHPDGPLLPDNQYARYVRYAVRNIGTEQRPLLLLLEVWYVPGAIERRLYQLDDEGKRIPGGRDLSTSFCAAAR